MTSSLKISEAAALALHTMALLACEPATVQTTQQLSVTLQCSEAHLSKVLQRLVKAGLLIASRGPRGGYTLAQSPAQIQLLQIWEAIDGPIGTIHCMHPPPVCDGTSCIFGGLVAKVNREVREYLENTTLADLSFSKGRLIRARS